ncbi:MAG: PaaI family thioesterase [Pseudomonadota bacterium]
MTLDDIRDYLGREFPQVFSSDVLSLDAAEDGLAVLRLTPDEAHLRPGEVISGPTVMLLADAAAYAALLSLGPAAKMSVTSNLNMSFLRAARLGPDIVTSARVLKMGKRLATIVCESASDETMIAHATLTYAMPPN